MRSLLSGYPIFSGIYKYTVFTQTCLVLILILTSIVLPVIILENLELTVNKIYLPVMSKKDLKRS